MTRKKHGRLDQAPSLFPFLAVLLCTVGALVLILVIVVSQSQASVKQAANLHAERSEEVRAQVENIRDSFKEDREKIQLEIEKKRLSLQSLEKQTIDLSKELESLSKTSELVDRKIADEGAETASEQVLTELQKKLQDAAAALKIKLEKPTGTKPVFAIVPYEGTSGTHRRPIYLECRADGVVIQPEGVLIGIKDLKPPYGPGNPLDAALRTIRTHYAPKDGALNTSAYPLLVVRSSGIRTYALARLAMAGWDDQFGYELIDDEMELAFPEGEPGLSKDIERTLAAARSRQAALVMAMPGRFRRAMAELSDENFRFDEGGGSGWDGSDADGDGSGGSGAAGGTYEGEALARAGQGSQDGLGSAGDLRGTGGQGLDGDSQAAGGSDSDGFGGLQSSPSALRDSGLGTNGGLAGSALELGTPSPMGNSVSPAMPTGRGGFAFAPDGSPRSSAPGSIPYGGGSAGGLQGFATGGEANFTEQQQRSGQASGQSWNGTGMPPKSGDGTESFADGAFSGNQYTRGGDPGGDRGEGGGQQAAKGQEKNAQSTGNSRPGTFRDAMAAARSKQQGSEDSQSSQPANSKSNSAADAGNGGSQVASPRSEGFGSASANTNEVNLEANGSPSVNLSGRKKENAEAVARRKGRNWAWSAGPSRDTAVVRTIRIICYEDRWIVVPDQGSRDKPATVMLDVALQTSAEELAKVVADRVDRWGFALSGGYWKPVLQVEVAAGGQRRYEQLKRLLDGSGLEIQLAAATPGAKPLIPAAVQTPIVTPPRPATLQRSAIPTRPAIK